MTEGVRTMRACHRAVATAGVALASLLVFAGAASARTISVYAHTEKYLDGLGSTAGTFACPQALAIHQGDGKVYVEDPCRFNSSFTAYNAAQTLSPFPAREGATSISLEVEGGRDIQVDNSSTESNGRIYALDGRNHIKAFTPEGTELGAPFPISGFLDGCGFGVDPQGNVWAADGFYNRVAEFTSVGSATGKTISTPRPCKVAIDTDGNFYIAEEFGHVRKYDSQGNFLFDLNTLRTWALAINLSNNHLFAVESPETGQDLITEYDSEGNPITTFGLPENTFGGLQDASTGIAINDSTHEIYVTNPRDYGGRQHVEIFAPSGQATVPTVTSDQPELQPTHVTLKGTVDLDGGSELTDCHFEWGTNFYFENTLPCTGSTSGPGVHVVSAELPGLVQGNVYQFRLTAKNANGIGAFGRVRKFRPQGPATVSGQRVSEVNTDGAHVEADIDPNGGTTTYRVEYGPEDCSSSPCQSAPLGQLAQPLGIQSVSVALSGLEPDTTYHYRVVAENEYGEAEQGDDTFHTFALEFGGDECPNALVRKQTLAARLPDCRAYELVSAPDAGGYDVLSDLITGQVPFTAKPRANDSVLYTLNYGEVPGVNGEPTNLGLDPYVAKRSSDGWHTRYVGINVGEPPAQGPFASTPSEESAGLSTLAFGGPHLCEPCFADGTTGIPVRRSDGSLVQGMAGSVDPGAGARPDGYIGRQLSADGSHLIFGSTSKFEPDGNSNGDVSIYDRNLDTGQTHVVSKGTGGSNLSCLQGAGSCHSPGDGNGIGALDVSSDGSRIIVAQRVSTDAAGNDYWHPYMNIGDSERTVDLAPGAVSGVLYDGMTADGSAVYYTTSDKLTADDHDGSPDIYRAAVASDGTVTLTRVSTGSGGTGDTNECDPAPAGSRNNWNAVGSASADGCGAVAFAGGAGVAMKSGTIYFLSPEKLDGPSNGTQDEPNLYAEAPGGSPKYVTTLEPDNPAVAHAVLSSAERSYGDIQVTPDGNFAVFSSDLALTGYPSFGHFSIYRYSMAGNTVACVSCAPTRAYLRSDSTLSRYGLNLSDDGRVFFSSNEPLALRDSGSTEDVYEWDNGATSLISTGRSGFDSGLLSVSSDGKNAYFFTRETLVPEDRNGNTVKIYDAREGGGFSTSPESVPCQASDECHGPGSTASESEAIGTFRGSGGNAKPEKPAKRHHKHHRHRRHRHKKRHATTHGRQR